MRIICSFSGNSDLSDLADTNLKKELTRTEMGNSLDVCCAAPSFQVAVDAKANSSERQNCPDRFPSATVAQGKKLQSPPEEAVAWKEATPLSVDGSQQLDDTAQFYISHRNGPYYNSDEISKVDVFPEKPDHHGSDSPRSATKPISIFQRSLQNTAHNSL